MHASAGISTKSTRTAATDVACVATAELHDSRKRRAHGFEYPSMTPTPAHARKPGFTKYVSKSSVESASACQITGARPSEEPVGAESSFNTMRTTKRHANCVVSIIEEPNADTPIEKPGSRRITPLGGDAKNCAPVLKPLGLDANFFASSINFFPNINAFVPASLIMSVACRGMSFALASSSLYWLSA